MYAHWSLENYQQHGFSFFSFFQQNSRWPMNHMLLSRAWTASPICSEEATYPGYTRFWCDSDITFLRGLHQKLVTVLYFSIMNVFWVLNLCGADGDASFVPQANLVFFIYICNYNPELPPPNYYGTALIFELLRAMGEVDTWKKYMFSPFNRQVI